MNLHHWYAGSGRKRTQCASDQRRTEFTKKQQEKTSVSTLPRKRSEAAATQKLCLEFRIMIIHPCSHQLGFLECKLFPRPCWWSLRRYEGTVIQRVRVLGLWRCSVRIYDLMYQHNATLENNIYKRGLPSPSIDQPRLILHKHAPTNNKYKYSQQSHLNTSTYHSTLSISDSGIKPKCLPQYLFPPLPRVPLVTHPSTTDLRRSKR